MFNTKTKVMVTALLASFALTSPTLAQTGNLSPQELLELQNRSQQTRIPEYVTVSKKHILRAVVSATRTNLEQNGNRSLSRSVANLEQALSMYADNPERHQTVLLLAMAHLDTTLTGSDRKARLIQEAIDVYRSGETKRIRGFVTGIQADLRKVGHMRHTMALQEITRQVDENATQAEHREMLFQATIFAIDSGVQRQQVVADYLRNNQGNMNFEQLQESVAQRLDGLAIVTENQTSNALAQHARNITDEYLETVNSQLIEHHLTTLRPAARSRMGDNSMRRNPVFD